MKENNTFTRREVLKTAGGVGAVGLAGCLDQSAGGGGGGGSSTWRLGTSSEGSSSFRIGSTWSEYDKQEDVVESVDVDAIVTEGTSASFRRFDAGEFELSGTTTQLLADAPDSGSFADQPLENFEDIRQLRGYMGFYNFGLYNAEKVSGWDDLEGRPVAISSAGSGTRPPVEWLVDQEIGLDNIDNRYMAFADIPSALRSGQVDAAFTWTVNKTTPQGWFQEIDATVDWEPLTFSDSTTKALQEELSYATYVELDGETVSSFTESYSEPIDTFTLTYLYVAMADQPDDVVYDLTKFMYENGETLVEEDEVMAFFPDPDSFLGQLHPDVPVHKGAYDYYTEAGIWSDYDLTAPPEAE